MEAYGFIERVRVNTESINVSQRCGDTSSTKEMHQRMDAFGIIDVEIPEHGIVRYICSRMPLVTSVHGREFDRIADEEHG